MRIIAFGDIHMSLGKFQEIPGIESADLLIITGDLTSFGDRHEAKTILSQIMEVNPNVLAQIGNLDDFAINDYLDELDLNLHGQARLFQGKVCLVGSGGSNKTPFHTPSEFSEEEMAACLKRGGQQAREFMEIARSAAGCDIPLIVVSHTPPLNTLVDQLADGSHVGSQAVRTFIETEQPDLCLTGHIHEASGQDLIGATPVFNPGMIEKGGWVDIHLDHKGLRASLEFV
jgi:Icc-related predicted phosphoesterase